MLLNFSCDNYPDIRGAFINGYQFSFSTWQMSFLVSAAVVAPLMFWWVHKKARDRVLAEELEHMRLENEATAEREREEARQRDLEARQKIFEERRRKEEQLERERQKKIEEKTKEVRGQGPVGFRVFVSRLGLLRGWSGAVEFIDQVAGDIPTAKAGTIHRGRQAIGPKRTRQAIQ